MTTTPPHTEDLEVEATRALEERAGRLADAMELRDRRGLADAIGDVFEELLGLPLVDPVTGSPVALWDRMRDLSVRIGRLETAELERFETAMEGDGNDATYGSGNPTVRDIAGNIIKVGAIVYAPINYHLEVATVTGYGVGPDGVVLTITTLAGVVRSVFATNVVLAHPAAP